MEDLELPTGHLWVEGLGGQGFRLEGNRLRGAGFT